MPPEPLALEAARKHLLWAITLLGAGLGLFAVGLLAASLTRSVFASGAWGLFAVLGWVFLVRDPWPLGRNHVRLVWASLGLAVAAAAVWFADPYIAGVTFPAGDLAAEAAAYRTQLLFDTVFAVVVSGSIFVASFAVQDRMGRSLLVLGLASAVFVQAFLYTYLSNAITQALVTATAAPAVPNSLDRFPSLWQGVGWVSALPLLISMVPLERLYWKLRRSYFRGASFIEV